MNEATATTAVLCRRPYPKLRDIDRHVGFRLRQRRIMLGLTQAQLGERVGVSYQQIHKYEIAGNRIAASKLLRFSRALEVDIGYFYEGIPAAPDKMQHSTGMLEKQRLLLDLVQHFRMIRDPRHREALAFLTRAIRLGDEA